MSHFFMTTENNWEMKLTGRVGQKPGHHGEPQPGLGAGTCALPDGPCNGEALATSEGEGFALLGLLFSSSSSRF